MFAPSSCERRPKRFCTVTLEVTLKQAADRKPSAACQDLPGPWFHLGCPFTMDGMENLGERSGPNPGRCFLLDLGPDELRTWLEAHGEPAMRGRQLRRWIFAGRAESFEHMSDLPQALRQALSAEFTLFSSRIARHLQASDGTHKLLLRLHDDELIECVLLQEAGRHTACISTQVGCGMGCVFCASGLCCVLRNLTSGEILEQLLRLRNLLPAEQRLTHIVVMGMGEPLPNLDHPLAALEVAGAKESLGMWARHITISTV